MGERDSSHLPAAHNDYVTGAKPQVLAGKWPDYADAPRRCIPQINRDPTPTRGWVDATNA